MYAQIHEVPQAIRELRPDCPPDLADAVTRMLEKEPENRWPSLKDAAAGVMGTAQVGPDTVAVLSQLAGQGPERRDGLPGSGSAPIPRRTPISAQVARTGSRPLLWFFAIGILVLAPLLWYLTHQASGRPSDTPPTAGDSAVASARAGAIAARVRARAAGLPASAIAPGDSVQAAAESMAVAGRQLEAAALFTTAADLWDSVLKSSSGIARPDSGARVAGPAPPPEPVSDSGALASYYETLAQAIESKQLGEVRRLLPNLTDFEVGAWRRLFEDRNVEAIDASYAILSFRSDGATATARVSSRLVVTKKGKPEAKEHPYYATLTRGPDGWREIRQEN